MCLSSSGEDQLDQEWKQSKMEPFLGRTVPESWPWEIRDESSGGTWSKSVTEKRSMRKAGRGCPGNPYALGAVLGTRHAILRHLSYSEGTERRQCARCWPWQPEMSLTKLRTHLRLYDW